MLLEGEGRDDRLEVPKGLVRGDDCGGGSVDVMHVYVGRDRVKGSGDLTLDDIDMGATPRPVRIERSQHVTYRRAPR